MKYPLIVLSSLLLLLLLQPDVRAQTLARKGQDHALFFVTEDYGSTSQFPSLPGAAENARALELEVRTYYGFRTEFYLNPSLDSMRTVLQAWSKKNFLPEDQLFVYFVGNGFLNKKNSMGYYSFANANDSLSLAVLSETVNAIPCPHLLTVVDACRIGDDAPYASSRGARFSRPGDNEEAERNRIIRLQLQKESRFFLSSGGTTYGSDAQDNAVFTTAFMAALQDARLRGDGLCTYANISAKIATLEPMPRGGAVKGHAGGGFVFINNDYKNQNMVAVKGGSFQMGSNVRNGGETPIHIVELDGFQLSKYEVTNDEFVVFLNAIDSTIRINDGIVRSKGARILYLECAGWRTCENRILYDGQQFTLVDKYQNHPVIMVTWLGAALYCNWLSVQHNFTPVYQINHYLEEVTIDWTANGYRLPTEAEWEYAARCRGGNYKWAGTNDHAQIGKFANADNVVQTNTTPVGSYLPNCLGIYDLSGNVAEWCWDQYGTSYYKVSPSKNPKGPERGTGRTIRGGSWDNDIHHTRTTARHFHGPLSGFNRIGFRVARKSK